MKLAVISDIHGNYKAMEAFLEYMEKECPDRIICLGDYVTDSPYPDRTMELVEKMMNQYPCSLIRGNREEYLIENYYDDQGWKPSSQNGSLFYTASNLSYQYLAFFMSLSDTQVLALEGLPPITICHGAPGEIRGNFSLEPEKKKEVMRMLATPYLLGGHNHIQEADTLYGKRYVNPGSLGLAVDGIGRRAQFALLSSSISQQTEEQYEWIPTFCSIPYDVEGYLQDFTESGLDEYGMILTKAVKKVLVTGRNYFYQCVVEAERISGHKGAQIPESAWKMAALHLGIIEEI